jgi:hypothetical protein
LLPLGYNIYPNSKESAHILKRKDILGLDEREKLSFNPLPLQRRRHSLEQGGISVHTYIVLLLSFEKNEYRLLDNSEAIK